MTLLSKSHRALCAVTAALIAAACASDDVGTVASGEAGGTVVNAETGDPAAGVLVTPLVGGVENAQGDATVYAVDPNSQPVVTDETGRFVVSYASIPEHAAVQVTSMVPSPGNDAVGRVDWRGAVEVGSASNQIEVVAPRVCAVGDEMCGDPQLPDLVPIVEWGQLPAETADRLRPPENAPPDAGLLPSTTWFVEELGEPGGPVLLRFATVAANVGDGPLDIIAAPIGDDGTALTWQRLWTDEWNFSDVESGSFLNHPTHDHIHFDAFERYRLLDEGGVVVAESEKVSFCLRDSVRIDEATPAFFGQMLASNTECGAQQQVINVGFGDHYHALLDDQWIEITDVPAGRYELEITIDPLNAIIESDESNNTASIEVMIP